MCDICGENPQQIQLGNMETGQQQFICAACAARWGLDFAKAVLPPEEIAAILGPMFVSPGRQEALGRPSKKGKGKGKGETAEPEPTPEPAAGDAEVAPAAANQ